MNPWKEDVCTYIDRISDKLVMISKEIHEYPEEKFEEIRASHLLSRELKDAGFAVEDGVGGLPTAIRATYPRTSEGATVALIGEYDALPEIGHACGHNLIAAAALGAVLAVGTIKENLPGTLLFMGTPGEEGGGGKAIMVEASAFNNVDAAMMVHPSSLYTAVDTRSLAITRMEIAFKGKPSHAAVAPEQGINALDAIIQTFNGLNALRQHIKDGTRVHGIVTDGGSKPNIVPEHAAAFFYVRTPENAYRDKLVEKLRSCAEGAALATGAELLFTVIHPSYETLRPNSTLARVFEQNWRALGLSIAPQPKDVGVGSTDMGNVSQTVPAVHVHFKICDESVAVHSREFEQAAISEQAHEMMLASAKALAMSAVDLLSQPRLCEDVRRIFLKKEPASLGSRPANEHGVNSEDAYP